MISKEHKDLIAKAYGFEQLKIETYFEGYGSKYVALINTDKGIFILKGMYYKNETFFSMYEYLKLHSYHHMFQLRNTLRGQLFIEIDGVVCYLYDYISGENLKSEEDVYYKIGDALAELHSIEVGPTLPKWDMNSLLSDIKNDRIPFISLDSQSILIECQEHFKQLVSLPNRIIHGDVAASNGIVKAQDHSIVLIDWDGCGVAPRIIDLAYPLFGLLSADLHFRWEHAKQLCRAYINKVSLTDEEKSCFIYAALLLPFNHILIGDTETKLKKIQWFLHNEHKVTDLLNF